MDEFLILIASLVVAVLFHLIRFGGYARVARLRQAPARLVLLGLSLLAAVIVVHSASLRIFWVMALIFCASEVGESLYNEIQIRRGKQARA